MPFKLFMYGERERGVMRVIVIVITRDVSIY